MVDVIWIFILTAAFLGLLILILREKSKQRKAKKEIRIPRKEIRIPLRRVEPYPTRTPVVRAAQREAHREEKAARRDDDFSYSSTRSEDSVPSYSGMGGRFSGAGASGSWDSSDSSSDSSSSSGGGSD